MMLECVTISVGYGDFLAQVAPFNRFIFDKWLIVTTSSDTKTREVCRRYGLHYILTEDHKRDGEFSKGRLIERGLQHLRGEGWRMHLDADTALPANTRNILEMAHLDPTCIYGCDRIMCQNEKQWNGIVKSGWLQNQHGFCHALNFPEGLKVGARWVSPREAYVPIGFMQLWNSSEDEHLGVRIKPYPTNHGNACRTDVQHALQWDRRKRILLPEILAVHIESEPGPTGINWEGRKSKPFGPCPS